MPMTSGAERGHCQRDAGCLTSCTIHRQVLISRAAMAAQESLFQTLGKIIAQRINFSEPSGEKKRKE